MIIRFSTIITALLLITDVRNARILQITDVHLDNDYNTKGDPKRMCHRNAKYSGDLGQFGDYMCDSPKSLLEHLLEATAMIIPKPDLLLLTGDFTPHISYYNFDYVHKAIEIVTDFVQRYYKNTTVLPVMGNHDTAPPDSFPDHNGSTIYRIAYNLWKHWIGEQNMETFLNGGYYKYNWDEKAIIIVLNTNLYYRFNNASKEFSNETDPAGQFTFLTDTLREAQETGKTAHIVAHIAPGVFEKTPYFTWLKPLYNQILINITIKFAGTIGWMIFGHHHTDTFHIVTNSKMEPVQVYLIAPSVTPWFSSLPGAGSLNPAFRIYHLDDHSQQLTDAVTYWIDLKQLNKDNSTPFTVEYSMQAAYDIESLNATSMNSILERLKNNDEETWQKYIKYNSVQWNVTVPQGIYKTAQLCSIAFPNFAAYNVCMLTDSLTTDATAESTISNQDIKSGNVPMPGRVLLNVAFIFLIIFSTVI